MFCFVVFLWCVFVCCCVSFLVIRNEFAKIDAARDDVLSCPVQRERLRKDNILDETHLIGGYRADTATGKPERVRVEILPIALERN